MTPRYILGVNLGSTTFGRTLHDGAACVVDESGVLAAVGEERIVGIKRAGGYRRATEAIRSTYGLENSDFRCVVVSSCCEPVPKVSQLTQFGTIPVLVCNHHVSHALSVFCISPYEQALIFILDAGGNTLGDAGSKKWWGNEREQQTYFVGCENDLVKVGGDFENAYAAGFGEVFRAFTYFLGWCSSRYAGNVMALAASGDAKALGGSEIFLHDESGNVRCLIRNDPDHPIGMAKELLAACGIYGMEPREPGSPILDVHRNIAAWVQSEFESSLCKLVNHWVEVTGIRNVCLAGGVAYNCKAIHALKKVGGLKRVFVGPASGDQGQCLGNALFGLWSQSGKIPRWRELSPYLGPTSEVKENEISRLVHGYIGEGQSVMRSSVRETVVKLIAMGCIVGLYQGRSEFGPRALGNRSILATPSLASVCDRLNAIKGRDSFMPFAPSVLNSDVARYFSECVHIPYMSEVLYVKEEERMYVEGIVNADGSARVHTVTEESNQSFFAILNEMKKITGTPIVLNTSFNRAGKPIVETMNDALASYLDMNLDALVIGHWLVCKTDIEIRMKEKISVKIGRDENYEMEAFDISGLLRSRNFVDKCIPRDRFLLQSEFLSWVMRGKKSTTIRYRRKAIEYPISRELPIFVTEDFSRIPRRGIEAVGRIRGLEVKQFGDLNHDDAVRDGFKSRVELLQVLRSIYGKISEEEPVMIYSIQIVS